MQRLVFFLFFLFGAFLCVCPAGVSAAERPHAQAGAPLFINMTSGDSWHGWMAFHFADSTVRMGHPVTIFLNLDAVKLAAKRGPQPKEGELARTPRRILAQFIRDGGVVLMCGPCLARFHLRLTDLIPGVRMGRPGLTQDYIFAPGSRSLTW